MFVLAALGLIVIGTRFLQEVRAMSISSVSASNEFARNMVAILKAGGHLREPLNRTRIMVPPASHWIAVEFPLVGERQVPVKCEQDLPLGQEVVVECVPHPFKAGRYVFQLAGAVPPAEID